MADSIKTELGFDVSKALSALKELDSALLSTGTNMGKAAQNMSQFNKTSGSTIGAMKKIATEANAASKALERLSKAQGKGGGTSGGGSGGPAGSGSRAPSGGDTAAIQAHIVQLQRLNSISQTATVAQQRAYQASITAAAQFAAKNKLSTAQVASQMQHLGKSFTGSADVMANKLNKVATTTNKALNSAGQSTRKFAVDWGTMVRIVSTQAIVRALSTLRNVLKSAIGDARKFQISIAEIATIAPSGNLNEYAESVKRISDAFNVPLDTTAAAYYQTISNQIGNTTAQFEQFVSASAKFSKTSVTDLAAAVNLGSGALNAYGKSANEAESVFAKFFVTIKQGRVVGEELAQGMGTVHPLAAKLGVSLEEVNASLATLTIKGVKADKAFTQLRGIFNSFLKPTQEMSAALGELGYASGQDILVAHDLQSALRLVIGTTDGTAQAVSKLVPRIRGLSGTLGIAGDKAEHFGKTMQLQGEAAQKLLDKGFKIIVETNAEKATKELNKLTNFMSTEFGPAMLKGAASFFSFIGGAETLKSVIGAVIPLLAPVALGIGVISVALAAMAIRARVASVGLTGLLGVMGTLALIPVAAALGNFIGSKIVASWTKETKAFEAEMAAQRELRDRKAGAELSIERAKAEKIVQILAQQFAPLHKAYAEVERSAAKVNENILSDMKSHTDSMIKEAQRLASERRKAAEDAGKHVIDSERRVGAMTRGVEETIFKSKLKGQTKEQQMVELTRKARYLSGQAAKKTADATTEVERKGGEELYNRAAGYAKEALSIAEGTKNSYLRNKAIAALRGIAHQNINAEKVYQQTLAASQKGKEKQAIEAEKNVSNLKKKQVKLLEAFTLYDQKTGKLLSGEDRTKKLESAHKLLASFIKDSGEALKGEDLINFASLSTQMGAAMDKFRIEELKASAESLQALHDQVQGALNKSFEVNVGAQGLKEAFPDIKLGSSGDIRDGINRYGEEVKSLTTKVATLNGIERKHAEQAKNLKFNYKEATESAKGFIAQTAESTAKLGAALDLEGDAKNLEYLRNMNQGMIMVRKAITGVMPTMEEFDTVQANITKSQKGVSYGFKVATGGRTADVESTMNNLKEMLTLQQQYQTAQGTGPEGQQGGTKEDATAELQRLQAAMLMLPEAIKPAADATGTLKTAASEASGAFGQAVSPTEVIATNMERGAVAATTMATQMANVKMPSFDTETAHWGKRIRHLASGGYARGTDQVPAMLTRGERVINNKSSGKFASQLTAMNAGVAPVYRQTGGTVTNIGDVSINVHGSKSSEQTARTIMKAFRRETRRGSGRS